MQLFDSHVATIKAVIIQIKLNRFLVKKFSKTISSQLKHPNIVEFKRVCLAPCAIMMEYMCFSFVHFDEREFLPEVKLYDVRRALGVNFSRYVLATTATTQRITAPPIFSLMTSNLAGL